MRIGVAQLNPKVGDVAGNLRLAKQTLKQAAEKKADIVLFTELFLSGYSPEDLVLKPAFLAVCQKAADELAAEAGRLGVAALIGLPAERNGRCYNTVMLLDKGEIIGERHKMDLPNYDEFDEKRIFTAGHGTNAAAEPIEWRGLKLGLPICEDIWNNPLFCKELANKGAEIILTANASPYTQAKLARRINIAREQARLSGLPLIYANQFGGQDELVFDGGSFILDKAGQTICRMKHFAEDLIFTDWQKTGQGWQCAGGKKQRVLENEEADYTACMIGLRDYMGKSGFKKAVLGMSGGIDSALCAVMAADAVGAENVSAIMLPYHYTTGESLSDAEQCAKNIGCFYQSLPIEKAVEAAAGDLAPVLEQGKSLKQVEAEAKKGKAFLWLENAQSRLRGVFLMAVSNGSGAMVVTTGNKSEMAVGFATLYGDMNGGFNPIKDIYKMRVYALSRWRNAHKPQGAKGRDGALIPQSIIDKAPSAELSEGQRDEDRLPPYPVLDAILHGLVEEDLDCAALAARGYGKDIVERVEQLLYSAEYKRRQSAPGVKVTSKAFGKVRRYPIVNGFRTRF